MKRRIKLTNKKQLPFGYELSNRYRFTCISVKSTNLRKAKPS